MMLESRYVAALRGVDFEAVMTGDCEVIDLVWLGDTPPVAGFEEVAPRIYVLHATRSDLDSVRRVQWWCDYQGEPFIVAADRGDRLLVSYAGVDFRKVATIGLCVEERDSIIGLVPRDEISGLRRVEEQIWSE